MTEAIGIHDHTSKKLGKKPEDLNKPKLMFAHHLAVTPDHPLVDAKPDKISYPMDKNDAAGDCVVAGTHHALQVIFNLLGLGDFSWTLDQILSLYQTQNPGFSDWYDAGTSEDNGMIIAQFLSWLVKNGEQFGLTGDRKLLGFAKVDHTDHEQMRAAVYLGLVLVTGANLQKAQQSTRNWAYVPGSPDWGGHCTAQPGYDADSMPTITWGDDSYEVMDSFIVHNMDEAYILLTQAHVNHPEFRNHFDLYSYAQAWQAMTGRTFPIPVSPNPIPPTPAPTPTPPPGGGASFQVNASVAAHIATAAVRRGVSSQEWINNHFAHYFPTSSIGQE